jgi:hypothetical protein
LAVTIMGMPGASLQGEFERRQSDDLAGLDDVEIDPGEQDRYGDKVKDKRGNISFDRLLRYIVERDDLTDDKVPMQRRCGLGSIVKRPTGEVQPTLANLRNDLAHSYPFDGLPSAGLLEVVRDLIDYAYRGMIAEHATPVAVTRAV